MRVPASAGSHAGRNARHALSAEARRRTVTHPGVRAGEDKTATPVRSSNGSGIRGRRSTVSQHTPDRWRWTGEGTTLTIPSIICSCTSNQLTIGKRAGGRIQTRAWVALTNDRASVKSPQRPVAYNVQHVFGGSGACSSWCAIAGFSIRYFRAWSGLFWISFFICTIQSAIHRTERCAPSPRADARGGEEWGGSQYKQSRRRIRALAIPGRGHEICDATRSVMRKDVQNSVGLLARL